MAGGGVGEAGWPAPNLPMEGEDNGGGGGLSTCIVERMSVGVGMHGCRPLRRRCGATAACAEKILYFILKKFLVQRSPGGAKLSLIFIHQHGAPVGKRAVRRSLLHGTLWVVCCGVVCWGGAGPEGARKKERSCAH